MRIALLHRLLQRHALPRDGKGHGALLERLGHQVDFPEEQTCCGQMHFNTGYARDAVPLVRRMVDAFANADAVVCPSASCTGMVRDHYRGLADLAGDSGLRRDVERSCHGCTSSPSCSRARSGSRTWAPTTPTG